MDRSVAVSAALALFGAGLAYRISRWFRHGLDPAARAIPARARLAAAARSVGSTLLGARITPVLRSLAVDVLLQQKLRRASPARWAAHAAILGAFVLLVLLHALGSSVLARLLPSYVATLNPWLFLRDLLGAALVLGLAAAAYRRLARRDHRRTTRPADAFALALLGVVALSGIALEATKLASPAAFRDMVAQYGEGGDADAALQAFWTTEMGTASAGPRPTPERVAEGRAVHERSCASCHASTSWAFVARPLASALAPASASLDRSGAAGLLSAVHFYACLLGLALLPFTKLFHLVATPVGLLVNAVLAGARPGSPNLATKQMIELDACTHCCACSARCSMAMASEAIRNESVLPSEKIAALRALASGRALAAAELRSLRDGVFLCTSCERCAVACPSGIDLLGLWTSAGEALLARREPEYALLSPLSLRRALGGDRAADGTREAAGRARASIVAALGSDALRDPATVLAPENGALWSSLRRSIQASTFAQCFGCKGCSTACPVVRAHERPEEALGLLPHQVMHAARLQLWSLVLGSGMLWDCLGCYQCQQHCPQGVGVTDVLYELKNLAIARAREAAYARAGGNA